MNDKEYRFKNIEGENISSAWLRAFMESATSDPPSLIVSIRPPPKCLENKETRNTLDEHLSKCSEYTCRTVANTIFPASLWDKSSNRHKLYNRYKYIWPYLSRYSQNKNGTYFQRLIGFQKKGKPGRNIKSSYKNQLEEIIRFWNESNNRRRSALQASIFDPHIDHKQAPYLGFPCMQQISFRPLGNNGKDGLVAVGYYPTQLIFEKAYGNYLGIYRIGSFMAEEMGLDFKGIDCISLRANKCKTSNSSTATNLLKKLTP
jgi:thymidylate synthase